LVSKEKAPEKANKKCLALSNYTQIIKTLNTKESIRLKRENDKRTEKM
jgi:hypothetical protein